MTFGSMKIGVAVGRGCTASLGGVGAGRTGSRFQLSLVLRAVSSRVGGGAGDGVGSTLIGGAMMGGAGIRAVAIAGAGVAVGRGVGADYTWQISWHVFLAGVE